MWQRLLCIFFGHKRSSLLAVVREASYYELSRCIRCDAVLALGEYNTPTR